MRVIAIANGYYGQLRREGDTFEVPDEAKATWFKPVGEGPAPTPPATEPEPSTFHEAQQRKQPGASHKGTKVPPSLV